MARTPDNSTPAQVRAVLTPCEPIRQAISPTTSMCYCRRCIADWKHFTRAVNSAKRNTQTIAARGGATSNTAMFMLTSSNTPPTRNENAGQHGDDSMDFVRLVPIGRGSLARTSHPSGSEPAIGGRLASEFEEHSRNQEIPRAIETRNPLYEVSDIRESTLAAGSNDLSTTGSTETREQR